MGKPFIILRNFLGEQLRQQLLDYALASETAFAKSLVSDGKTPREDDEVRISRSLGEFGELQDLFTQKVLDQVPSLIKELGLRAFEPAGIQSEIIAHNEGDFFRCHIDTFSGAGRSPQGENRLITLVYYFYREPRAFSGGELCLYPLSAKAGAMGTDASMINFAIEQDTALVFSSMLPHEVRKVSCKSGQFADSRFSINSWVVQAR